MKVIFLNRDNSNHNNNNNNEKNINNNKDIEQKRKTNLNKRNYDSLLINFYDSKNIVDFMKTEGVNKIILYINEKYYFQFKLHYLNIFGLKSVIENGDDIYISNKLKKYFTNLLSNFDRNVYTYCNRNFHQDDVCDLCSIRNVIANHLINKLKYDEEFREKLLSINNYFESELDLMVDLMKTKSIHFLSGTVRKSDLHLDVKIFGFNQVFFSEINKTITEVINNMNEFSYDNLPLIEVFIKDNEDVGIIPVYDLTIKKIVEKSVKDNIKYFKQTILKEFDNKTLKNNFDIVKNVYHNLLIYVKEQLELIG